MKNLIFGREEEKEKEDLLLWEQKRIIWGFVSQWR